ncbi:MAG: phosphate acyltransferase [Alistipes timonensis]|nr:phosphate acyltransferase [Alistipes timonensis]
MEQIRNFKELAAHLSARADRKKIAVVCADDPETQYAVERALREQIADFILVGDSAKLRDVKFIAEFSDRVEIVDVPDSDEAARRAVELAREGRAGALMKGIINTDNFLRAILNKETGILPQGSLLTHMTASQVPGMDRLLFFSDVAVIPYPTLEQKEKIIRLDLAMLRHFGIERPKVALIHFTEKVNPKFPNSVDAKTLVGMAADGAFGNAALAGPMDVKTACDLHSAQVKGLVSEVAGAADLMIFPNIESANTFYKTLTFFGHAEVAGMLLGPKCPVVLTSRADTGLSKFYSLAMAVLGA